MILVSGYGLYKKKVIAQLSHYLIASILGTVAHYLTMLCLVQLYSVNTILASTIGAIIGAAIIYFLNYFVVFKSVRRHREAITRFFLVALLGVVLNGAILKLLTSMYAQHYLVLQVLTTTIVFGCNFALNRGWTFAAKIPNQQHML